MKNTTGAPSGSRLRLLAAARTLIARNGVNGTSLQMIADELGVTKAAVYHQFRSKDEIVLAVMTPAALQLAALAERAEARPTLGEAFDEAIDGLVELILDNREYAAAIQRDPEVVRILGTHEPFRAVTARVNELLIGAHPSDEDRVALSVTGGGLLFTGMDAALADIDRETMRGVLLRIARASLRRPAD